jgi:hypothetical protein
MEAVVLGFSTGREAAMRIAMVKTGIGIVATLLVLGLAACSTARPAVYPNEHYKTVGSAQADADIADCEAKAQEYVKTGGRGGEMAKEGARNVAVGAAVGGASGAVGGAIGGNPAEGAAVGAASGATAGLLGTMFGWMFRPSEPDPLYRNFVETCLRDKGYQPIGWQ